MPCVSSRILGLTNQTALRRLPGLNKKPSAFLYRLLELNKKYQSTFFQLSELFGRQRFDLQTEIPENNKKLADSLYKQSWTPYFSGIGSAAFSFAGVFISKNNAGLKAISQFLGREGFNCYKESSGSVYESKHTSLRSSAQTGESKRDAMTAAENTINQSFEKFLETIAAFAKTEESIASQ